ncbi:MAG: hypothetical protein AAGJ08_21965 [Cyanobacteria bacterium P01_H01_bin.35]
MAVGIDDLIIGAVAGWAVSKALDGMLEQIVELEDALSEKLERLLQSPYVTGKNSLQLAFDYVNANQHQKALHQLCRATDYFDQAGSQLDGLEQLHAYCLAGLSSSAS